MKFQTRKTLIDVGYPSGKVDEVMKEVAEMPQSLVDAYINMLK